MSTVPRVSSAIPGEAAHFASVLAHQPLLAGQFAELYGTFWGSDILSARVKELCRMRNARITQCGFCRQVRFDKALQGGLGEDVISDVTDDYAQSDKLTAAEKAALLFTDALIFDPALLDAGAASALRRNFTPPQIAELAIGVALFLALAKVLITLGLEPNEMDTTVLPTPRCPDSGADLPKPAPLVRTPLDSALSHHPDLFAQFRAFASAPEGLLDPTILGAARHRIAVIHGCAAEMAGTEAGQRALPAFVEKLPFAHHAITDDEAAAARDELGEAQFVAFVVASALCDAICRLHLVTNALSSADDSTSRVGAVS